MNTTAKLSDNEIIDSLSYTDYSSDLEELSDIASEISTNSSSEKDIDFGEIYLVKCTKTNLCYIGQAKKYNSNLEKKGGKSRWNQHCTSALSNGTSQFNSEFHKAIREHGKDSFTLEILCTCHKNELNDLEKFYIKKFNTLHPNGYNMTEGGSDGKHCELANKKKCVKRRDYSDESKQNMSKGQIGKRYEEKPRKNQDDTNLPKNIAAIRRNGELLGYQVKKFPMGIDTKEYIYKTFKNKAHPEIALEKATEYLEFLKQEYEKKVKDYKEEQDSIEQSKKLKLPKYPDNVFPFVKDMKLIGYYVKGLTDYNNTPIPKRIFINNTLNVNYEHVTKFLKLVKDFNDKKETPKDWLTIELPKYTRDEHLPKYIRKLMSKGEESGYRVDYYIGFVNNEQIIQTKAFTSRKLSMDQKLELAKKYVEELDKQHKQTE